MIPAMGGGKERIMRKLVFGLLGFAALGFGALSAQPAEAQPFYPGYGYGYRPVVERYHARPVVRVQYRRPYGEYRPYRAYRPVRPVRRCWIERRGVRTPYGWVRRPVEVCRTAPRPYYRY
jgi:hypothetical protein